MPLMKTVGDTQTDYKHILSALAELLAERAQSGKLTMQLRKALDKLIGIFFSSIIEILGRVVGIKNTPLGSNK